MIQYFSDEEQGFPEPSLMEFTDTLWAGVNVIINRLLKSDSMAEDFPKTCEDEEGISGSEVNDFWASVYAEIPGLSEIGQRKGVPGLYAAFDLIQFVHHHVSEPVIRKYHSYWGHNHYTFGDRAEAQARLRGELNRLFKRNAFAYALQDDGRVLRLIPTELSSLFEVARFDTTDQTLDSLLNEARALFLAAERDNLRTATEKLWDAWERLKTIEPGSNKATQAAALLDRASSEECFRQMLDREAKELTSIGNSFRIRHSETTQIDLESDVHRQYLFFRLFSLMQFLLRQSGRV